MRAPETDAPLLSNKEWPFREAAALHKRLRGAVPDKGYVLFSTGYGPSGLPHIGTFGEALRTTMVRNAFAALYPDIPTKLFCVSDDMDGLRKIPDNIPNGEETAKHVGKPLTAIPDPFGTHESFGAHMNARLCAFLDAFGFDYRFVSATARYKSGAYDAALLKALENFDAIMRVMLPTLGEERRKTYNPFMPVCPDTGRVLQVPALSVRPKDGTFTYLAPNGEERETTVTGGACKLQWKPDWGMRWTALGVDYEMYGKDLKPSADVSGRICNILGGRPPAGMMYELFLDEKGEKISKSKGNGLSLDEWLRYAPRESLAYYMYRQPSSAKKLHFDVIPKATDEFLSFRAALDGKPTEEAAKNPAWHVERCLPRGEEEQGDAPVSFSLLLNLASACCAESEEVLWGFIRKYAPDVSPRSHAILARMVDGALRYYADFVKPSQRFRAPTSEERAALHALRDALASAPEGADAETLQNIVYSVGKNAGYDNLRDWFGALYEILLGQESGPRMGSFFALYGVANSVAMIDGRLALS
ncbi:MAG: lysine--tRNA ligase [Rickettsiales bacterium]